VLLGAGDIASRTSDADEATAKLLDVVPGTVFTTGDNAYASGTDDEFTYCYAPIWGRHKDRTMPSVGNHEYQTTGAQPVGPSPIRAAIPGTSSRGPGVPKVAGRCPPAAA